jgi:hypothetical protein
MRKRGKDFEAKPQEKQRFNMYCLLELDMLCDCNALIVLNDGLTIIKTDPPHP